MINDTDAVNQRPDTYAIPSVRTSLAAANGHANGSVVALTPAAVNSKAKKKDSRMVAAVAHATVPSWANMVMMASLIFGGCCTNVSPRRSLKCWR